MHFIGLYQICLGVFEYIFHLLAAFAKPAITIGTTIVQIEGLGFELGIEI